MKVYTHTPTLQPSVSEDRWLSCITDLKIMVIFKRSLFKKTFNNLSMDFLLWSSTLNKCWLIRIGLSMRLAHYLLLVYPSPCWKQSRSSHILITLEITLFERIKNDMERYRKHQRKLPKQTKINKRFSFHWHLSGWHAGT